MNRNSSNTVAAVTSERGEAQLLFPTGFITLDRMRSTAHRLIYKKLASMIALKIDKSIIYIYIQASRMTRCTN